MEVAEAVVTPVVFQAASTARLKDLIDITGGLSLEADRDYFSRNFNLAKLLTDQEKIYVPSLEENSISPSI